MCWWGGIVWHLGSELYDNLGPWKNRGRAWMLCPCRVLTRASSLVPTSPVRHVGARRCPRFCCCASFRVFVVPGFVSPSARRVRCFCPSEDALRIACALFCCCVCCDVPFCAQLTWSCAWPWSCSLRIRRPTIGKLASRWDVSAPAWDLQHVRALIVWGFSLAGCLLRLGLSFVCCLWSFPRVSWASRF